MEYICHTDNYSGILPRICKKLLQISEEKDGQLRRKMGQRCIFITRHSQKKVSW
jgi:hypothetical protein